MAFFEDDDIRILLADDPHTVSMGSPPVEADCLYFEEDTVSPHLVDPAQVLAHASILVKTSAFPDVQSGDECDVFNKADSPPVPMSFTIFQMLKIQDGALTQVLLRRV